MSSRWPDAEQPQGKKPEILRAAAKFFLTDGYRASSIEKIACEVGILKGSLYYHIRSKDDLLCQVIQDALVRAEHNLLQGAALVESPAAGIRKRLESHFDYICLNCSGLAALIREAEHLPACFEEEIRAQVERYEGLLTQALRSGQRLGVVTGGDAAVLTQMMIGACAWPTWIDRETARQSQIRKGILRLLLPASSPREAFPNSAQIVPGRRLRNRGRQKTL